MIGVNAITIYIGKRIIPFEEIVAVLPGRRGPAFGLVRPAWSSRSACSCVEWLFLLHLYRNRIFLRV